VDILTINHKKFESTHTCSIKAFKYIYIQVIKFKDSTNASKNQQKITRHLSKMNMEVTKVIKYLSLGDYTAGKVPRH